MLVTVMDVMDQSVISSMVKEELYKCYPSCKRAQLKTGGNFPYLSRPAEVNMHIKVHLRSFDHTRYSAKDHEGDVVASAPEED